jgi:23S rRNA maturation mini-RNase III
MGLKKIIKNLQVLLDTKQSRLDKQVDAVQDLVNRLERKEAKFRRRLANADSEEDKKKIKSRLKVCKAQRKKGQAALKQLQDSAE